MTDKEIIKALEYCKDCSANLNVEIIDLITRQQKEIEKLKECPKCVYEYDGEITEHCIQGPCSNFKTVEQVKAEAVKEFAERLKHSFFDNGYESPDVDFDYFVDNLVKELMGENND